MRSEKVKVMVVDDSAVIRGFWTKVIDAQPDMSVVTTAINGLTALDAFKFHQPDLVILDLEMPVMDGLTALPFFISKNSNAKVIVVSALTQAGSEMAVKALTLGAADYIAKPSTQNGTTVEDVSNEIIQKIRLLVDKKAASPDITHYPVNAIVIGASTGGPNALVSSLKELNPLLTQPIFIVQHMPASFIEPLAQRISASAGRPCLVATDKMKVEPSCIYIAPGDFHMTIEKIPGGHELRLNTEPPENFCRPAVDPLFRSAARAFDKNLLAVILTGMGEDGKKGSEVVKSYGGKIIAQDEGSSVVWGMPGAVVKSGLADSVKTLEDISKTINLIARG